MVIRTKKSAAQLHLRKRTKKRKSRLTGGTGVYTCDKTKLGTGSFGTVLECKSNDKTSIVAVKIAKNEKSIHELQNEIDIYIKLGNENTHIVKMIEGANIIFEGGQPNPGHYLVLEYCNSGDLSNFVKENDTYNITEILKQIFNGMTYLFEKHVLHLDLKPGNILVHTSATTGEHTFKIADFGLAKDISTPNNDNTIKVDLTTMKAGTPIYKPTFKNIDRSTYFRDLYAFYCIMYYLYYRIHYNIMSEKDKTDISTYETKQILKLTQPQIISEISDNLIELQKDIFTQIKEDFEKIKAQGSVFTPRGKPNLNLSGINVLNISGLESNDNEPSFDKINVNNKFYKSYYSEINKLLKKALPIKPLTQKKVKEQSVNTSLAGNTVPVTVSEQ